MAHRFRAALAAAALVAAAACTQTAAPPPAPTAPVSAMTPSSFALPAGSGCAGEVSRYRAVMDNDLATGHVAKAVHARITAEIDQAASACGAGRDAESVRMIAATKARFGYR